VELLRVEASDRSAAATHRNRLQISGVTFTSAGGTLKLDSPQTFAGTIAGFASPSGVTESIDLVGIAPGNNPKATFTEAVSNLSGTLSIGGVNLTLLGQYTAADFSAASDGAGGTVITDPAQTASTGHHHMAAVHGSGTA
jgi:hypothetical protein